MRRIRAHAHAVAAPHAPPLEVSPPIVRKVPGETAFLHHLIVSVPSSLLHLPHSKASRLPLHSFERSRAFPQFVRSFRRCAVFRVFCSPSEGAQSPGTLCRACTRVFVSSRLLPPSEGVQFSAFSAHLLKVRNRSGPSVGPVPAFSAHLPKVRNRPGPSVGSVPAFLFPAAFSHLPKVRNLTGPSVAPVFAFLFPAASFHLPKAGQIRQYPYHLWKVCTSIFSATAADSAFLCRCGKGPGRQCCLENL